MPTIEKIFEELHWLSDLISTQVRTISVSLLIITWGLIIGKPEISQPLPQGLKKNLLVIGILALIAMFGDFLQYFFGYWNADSLRKTMEQEGQTEAEYDYRAITYKLRAFFFWFKQTTVLIACIWFLAVIISFCIRAILMPTP